MKKIGLGLDYNNICKDYNTVYLDRDNDDRETVACMKKALKWFDDFFSEFMKTFDYNLYRLNANTPLALGEIVKKRFFFYSLEKEILAQTFIFQKENRAYDSIGEWSKSTDESLMVQNDEEGEGVYFYFNENSNIHKWLLERLSDCSLDEIPFEEA